VICLVFDPVFAQDQLAKIEAYYFAGHWTKGDSLLELVERETPFSQLRASSDYLKVKVIRHYYHFEILSAEQSLTLATRLAENAKNVLLQAEVGEWLCHVFMKKNEPDRAIQFYSAALDLRKASGLDGGMSDFYLNYFLASANYVFGLREKEKEDLPFVRSNWSHGSKPLKISAYDSLVFSFVKKGIEALPRAAAQKNYKSTQLFTQLVQLPVSPDQYEELLLSLSSSVTEQISTSPISLTLLAQKAVWHLSYYRFLMDEFNMKVPVVHRHPESDFLKLSTFTKKGRTRIHNVKESITRLHTRSDLNDFYKAMAALQKAMLQNQSSDQSTLSKARNQCADLISDVSKIYRDTYLSTVEIQEQERTEEKKLIEAKNTARLNLIDKNLGRDRELYANYLLRKAFTLDSTAGVWFQKSLVVLDKNLPMQLERNPMKSIVSLTPRHETALEALLLKAEYESKLGYAKLNESLAMNFNQYPFTLSVENSNSIMTQVREKFQRMAVKTWRRYEELYDVLLRQLPHDADRYYWAGQTRLHRLTAMEVAFSYLPTTAKTPSELMAMEDVFYFSERTKATVFLNDLSTSVQAQSVLLTVVQRQKRDSLLHWVNLLDTRARKGFKSATDSISTIQQELEKILPRGSKSHSELFELPSLADVQRLLDPTTAIIWWVTAPENLFRFVLTSSQLKVSVKLRKEEKNLPLIKGMRNGILFQDDQTYRETAIALFKKVMPNLDDEVKSLILVPDKEMNLIPFETLLMSKVSKKEIGNWASYPYLIKRLAISYQPSVLAYWLSQKEKGSSAMEFLGYAPIFDQGTTNEKSARSLQSILDQMDSEGKFPGFIDAGQVSALPATRNEIESIRSTFEQNKVPTKVFLSDQAVEKNLRNQHVTSATVIHMATHGFANPHEPSECGVLMADILHPSQDDGILYGYEIALMDLPAKLVTLSACETGLGKVLAGEGSLSLTRNFLLAGAKNVLSSLWKVPDEETSQLMILYYNQLIRNQGSFSSSLQQAKLEMINKGKGNPYFWSAFVLTGQ